MDNKVTIAHLLHPLVEDGFTEEELQNILEVPKDEKMGDIAFPAFQLAKVRHQNPKEIAEDIVSKLPADDSYSDVKAVGPYVNFSLNRDAQFKTILSDIFEKGADYGSDDLGHGRNVTIDMSSPNIAKPMSMGHLRSTVIGNSLAEIVRKMNYTPVKINHLGDWGTQFGKLIAAYRGWGDPERVEENAINELVKLYVEFHERAEENPELDDEARATFRALENGDPEVTALWEKFRRVSLEEFQTVYDRLNITFDSYKGEAFYNDKMDEVVDDLTEKRVLKKNEGAMIVELEDEELPPALIKKSDGATLYITRDLATAYYRKRTYDFAQSLYVVGSEQSVHFEQLKAVLQKLGKDWQEDMHHIKFGLITVNGKKLSTRKGKIILLKDVLDRAVDLAHEQIEAKNPDLENKEAIAEAVGTGAVIFHDLKNERLNNFDFNLEEVVQFEGETGPYVQYANARAHSILRKAGEDVNADLSSAEALNDDYSWRIVKRLGDYPAITRRAFNRYEPSVIAKYAIDLAQDFNKYYGNTRILDDDSQLQARLALVKAVTVVLEDALSLLGVKAPQEM